MTSTPKKTDADRPLNHIFCCDSCDYEKHVGPELSGRKAKCPKCGQIGRVGTCSTRSPEAEVGSPGGERISPGGQLPTTATKPHGLKAIDRLPNVSMAARTGHSLPTAHAAHSEPTTRCPYCREEILIIARKCKHCGEYLEESLRIQMERRKAGVPSSTKTHGQMPLTLPRPRVLIVGSAVVLAVAAIALWAFRGNSGPTQQPNEAKPAALPAFEPMLASVRKGLEGTEVKDATGSMVRFLTVAEDGPWTSSVHKADVPGNPAHASIEASYRLTNESPKISSSRGKIILQFVNQAGVWQFQSASRRICFITTAGKEKEVPEDDQQTIQLTGKDPILQHIRRTIQKTPPGGDD